MVIYTYIYIYILLYTDVLDVNAINKIGYHVFMFQHTFFGCLQHISSNMVGISDVCFSNTIYLKSSASG